MEFVIGLFCFILVLSLLQWIADTIKAVSWWRFLLFFMLGGGALAVLFSFTSEGVFVVIGAYAVLLIIFIFWGILKRNQPQ